MRIVFAVVCFILAVNAMNAESSHAFLDGFTITVGNGYDLSTDTDETTVTVALPGQPQITGNIFYSKAMDEQLGNRNEYMKLLARNIFAAKFRDAFAAGKRVAITITPAPGKRDFKAHWIVLKTVDKRGSGSLAFAGHGPSNHSGR
jgi:hypothetical protein